MKNEVLLTWNGSFALCRIGRFPHVFFLLWVQVAVSALVACAAWALFGLRRGSGMAAGAKTAAGGGGGADVPPPVSSWPGLFLWSLPLAASYLSAMLSSNMALLIVDYPTQVLIKSSKPIPVMAV